MSSKISPFFNPSEHLVFHQDKEGNMMGGGYRVNNLLYQHKMPLFVSVGAGAQTGGGDAAAHFIPEKFSDLFRDLAVPAGLFMMPAMFRPRNYAFEVPEAEAKADAEAGAGSEEQKSRDDNDDDTDTDTDTDDENENDYKTTKHAPNDIFDTLLSLVEAKERIHHDVKTRRHRLSAISSDNNNNNNNNKKTKNNSTKRRRMK